MSLLRLFNKIILLILVVIAPAIVCAEGSFEVHASTTDFKIHPGEDANFEVTLKNLMPSRFTSVYVFVNDLDIGTDTERGTSLGSWVEIPRYIELKPGEERKIISKLNINRLAATGKYRAEIAFVEAMDEAGAMRALNTAPKLNVNAEVFNDAITRLQINRFLPKKNFYIKQNISFGIELENVGDTTLYPASKIAVYDSDDKMVAEQAILDASPMLVSKGIKTFDFTLNNLNSTGKFRAILTVVYDGATTTETTSFVVLPFIKIAVVFFLSLSLLLFALNYFYKIYEQVD